MYDRVLGENGRSRETQWAARVMIDFAGFGFTRHQSKGLKKVKFHLEDPGESGKYTDLGSGRHVYFNVEEKSGQKLLRTILLHF